MRRNVAHFIGGATRITGAGGMTILGCTLCGAAISAVGGGGHNALCTDCYEALTQPLSENGLLLRDAYADARRALSRKDADAIQSARDEAVEEAAKVADSLNWREGEGTFREQAAAAIRALSRGKDGGGDRG